MVYVAHGNVCSQLSTLRRVRHPSLCLSDSLFAGYPQAALVLNSTIRRLAQELQTTVFVSREKLCCIIPLPGRSGGYILLVGDLPRKLAQDQVEKINPLRVMLLSLPGVMTSKAWSVVISEQSSSRIRFIRSSL